MSFFSRVKNAVPSIPIPKPDIDLPKLPKPSDVVKPLARTVDLARDTFERAKDNPVTRTVNRVISDPKDAVRDLGREGLRLAYHGADRFVPGPVKEKALSAAELGLDVLDKGASAVLGKDSKPASIIHDLARVDLEGITRDDGLKADWGKLWGVWLFEEKPASLGTWDKTSEGVDRVTVTDQDYIDDVAGRPHQKAALDEFLKQHPNPKPGDKLTTKLDDGTTHEGSLYAFTGPGTVEGGDYTAAEWFLGSYNTTIECTGVDPKTGKPELQFQVTNTSHWESATRLPQSFQDKGLPPSLVGNHGRDEGTGLGGDFIQRYQWTQTVDVPAQRPGMS